MNNPMYLIKIGEQEQGPYRISDLEMYEQMGEIKRDTPVRADGHDIWKKWSIIKAEKQEERARASRYAETLNLPTSSRQSSKHPVLRFIVGLWIVGAVISFFTGIIVASVNDVTLGCVLAVSSVFWFFICQAFWNALK